jgi:hypothetical protein
LDKVLQRGELINGLGFDGICIHDAGANIAQGMIDGMHERMHVRWLTVSDHNHTLPPVLVQVIQ